MKAYTAQKLKAENRMEAYRLLLREGPLSKAELSAKLGISAPTAGKIIDSFLANGIAVRSGAYSNSAGRPAEQVRIDEHAFFFVGVVLEGNYLRTGIIDPFCRLIAFSSVQRPAEFITDTLRHTVPAHIHALCDGNGIDTGRLRGIGIGTPGVFDPDTTTLVTAPLIGIAQPLCIADDIQAVSAQFGCPVVVDNDINMAVRGQQVSGAESLLLVSLGTGLGAGLILDGKLVRGGRNRAGEIGYSRFVPSDQTLLPGAGWLEDHINLAALATRFDFDIGRLPDNLTPYQKQTISAYICQLLAPCIANITLMLDIDHVVVSGIIPGGLAPHFYTELDRQLARCTPFSVTTRPPADDRADTVGAANAAYYENLPHILTSEGQIVWKIV